MVGKWLLLLMVPPILSGATPARPDSRIAAAPSTTLIGQSWLGLWRGGRMVVSRHVDGWTLRAARLSKDRRTLEIAASRAAATQDEDVVLLFDARTLAMRGRKIDPSMTDDPVRVPIGTDLGGPDDVAKLSRLPIRAPAGRSRRVVLSPDGTTVAVFVQPAAAGAPWRGTAIDRRTGRVLVAPGLSIDDGSRRENGSMRAIACLLPRGEGVIYTLLGAPADTVSEYQRFGARAAPVELRTPYVMGCLTAS